MREELIHLAEAAGRIGLGYFRGSDAVGVEEKGHLDLVTRADRDVEAFLVAELSRLFPDDGVRGEEGASVNPDASRQWVIDPIDGTFNFVRGMDSWAVSIGLYEAGAPAFGVIHAPARGQTLAGGPGHAVTLNGRVLAPLPPLDRRRGVIAVGFSTDTPVEKELAALRFILEEMKFTYRHCGSTTAAFVMLAEGQVDACLGFGVRSWDVMAGLPVVVALGGEATIDWGRSDLAQQFDYLAGSVGAVALARPILSGAAV